MIEHDASGASGSAERGGARTLRRRHPRTFALGCLAIVLALGAVFWRQIAILWCFTVARASDAPDVIAWNEAELAHFGAPALPAVVRLVERKELQRAWSGGSAMYLLAASDPEARAAIHDLLGSSSERVRAVAGMVLVSADEHDASGLPALVEGLGSSDADVRFFSAFYLSYFPGPRFAIEIKDAPRVFVKMAAALEDGLTDPRRVFIHGDAHGTKVTGQYRTVPEFALIGLKRLDPNWTDREHVDAALAKDARQVFDDSRIRLGDFWTRNQEVELNVKAK